MKPRTLLLLCLAACGGKPAPANPQPTLQRPTHGILVEAGSPLAAAIAAAPAGATLRLAKGRHQGPLVVDKPLQIWGEEGAILEGKDGSTLRLTADGAAVRGLTITGSGQRFDLMDGGVLLRGNDLVLEACTIQGSLFGILVQGCQRALVRGNRVIGTGQPAMGLRGDGIRLWETYDSEVLDNTITGSRDMVVWYSSRNRLAGNRIRHCRYGTHFMYSHDNTVTDSRFVDCEVGVFVMYSSGIRLQRNLIARAAGAAGIGLGLKEAGDLLAEDNWFLANTTAIYLDASPLHPEHHNLYQRNVIRFSEVAIACHSGIARTGFRDNHLADNGAVLKVGGHGDALRCDFDGNYYDSYRGYDLDGDGRGDVPFEFRRLSTQLEGRYPELALLHGAPAMALVDLVGEVMPLFAPKPLLRDQQPRMRPPAMRWTPENDDAS
jgi:nitrous oxidase accessory protein